MIRSISTVLGRGNEQVLKIDWHYKNVNKSESQRNGSSKRGSWKGIKYTKSLSPFV